MKMDCKFLKDFKAFAMRGNVLDMAVGVIIGGAFGKIVTSLVNNVVMPLLGMLVGGIDFTSLQWVLSPAQVAADGTVVREEVAMQYGLFLQNTFDFIVTPHAKPQGRGGKTSRAARAECRGQVAGRNPRPAARAQAVNPVSRKVAIG